MSGTWASLTPQQQMYLQQGLLYVNIHTPAFPGGELRNQLTGFETVRMQANPFYPAVLLPLNSTNGAVLLSQQSGSTIFLSLDSNYDLIFVIRIVTSNMVTGAHFHGPAPLGSNANALYDFTSLFPTGLERVVSGTWASLTPQQQMYLQQGQLYVNIHTPAFPGGELRQQLTSFAAVPVQVVLPLNATSGSNLLSQQGNSSITLSLDASFNLMFTIRIVTSNMVTGAHFHGPAPLGSNANALYDFTSCSRRVWNGW